MKGGKIRWGLLGAGAILNRWMKGAVQVEDMEIVAVASRTMETVRRMANQFSIPNALSYEELLERDDVDAVYIPVPHAGHKELALKAMKAGKHVLVEKPAAVTAKDFDEMTACAAKQRVFFMEAMWTRFFPLIEALRICLDEERIGQVRALHSSFAFRSDPQQSPRLFLPEQAGGALLDTGVYNLHFAEMVFQKQPEKITGLASINVFDLIV